MLLSSPWDIFLGDPWYFSSGFAFHSSFRLETFEFRAHLALLSEFLNLNSYFSTFDRNFDLVAPSVGILRMMDSPVVVRASSVDN